MNVQLTKEQKIKVAIAEDVAKIMQSVLKRETSLHRKQEHFWTIGLNIKNTIEYIELVSLGGINSVHVEPIEVFSFAVAKKCKKIILVHNHPSGELKPSKEDIEFTKNLKAAGEILKIEVLDHIIITEDDYTNIL